MKYIDQTSKLIREYFSILSPNYPEWLNEYIETERMQKQKYISVKISDQRENKWHLKAHHSIKDK